MLKLLIVEDNDLERNALANYFNWDIMGIQLVDIAYNGKDGLAKVKLHNPDIIISDVKMPVMDGIEMAKTVMQTNPNIKFIFSSGYDDAALLKEALQIRAHSYIMKPVDPEELTKVVTKLASLIINEKLENMEKSRIINQYKDNLEYLQEKFLKKLIFKEKAADNNEELYNQANNLKLRISGIFKLILVELHNQDIALYNVLKSSDRIIKDLKKDFINESIRFIDIEQDKIIIIVNYLTEKSTIFEDVIKTVEMKLKGLNESNLNFTIGISESGTSLFELHKLFVQCCMAVDRKIELGYGKIIQYESSENNQEAFNHSCKNIVKEEIRTISDKIFKDEPVEQEINNIISIISKSPGLKLENIKSAFISLFSYLAINTERSGEDFEKIVEDEMEIYKNIICSNTIPDIVEYVNRMLKYLSSYLGRKKTNKDDYIVNEILNILNNEYNQPITLTYLSDRVYLSPNYLRILFKTKMHISIQDYLTNVRINKAKSLLKQNNHKVHEVGEMVGYSNKTYFNIVFKNYTNLTPGEYRKKYLV